MGELYKKLLDGESHELKEDMLEAYYTTLMPLLMELLTTTQQINTEKYLSLHVALELLLVSVKGHGLRIRYFIIHNMVFTKLQPLFRHCCKSIRLSVLRLLRALVESKDECLSRHIVKHDLLSPVVDMLRNSSRDNLIRSASIELFEYILKQDMKALMVYLLNKHIQGFDTTAWPGARVFHAMKQRYDVFPATAETPQSQARY